MQQLQSALDNLASIPSNLAEGSVLGAASNVVNAATDLIAAPVVAVVSAVSGGSSASQTTTAGDTEQEAIQAQEEQLRALLYGKIRVDEDIEED
jgi:hypothetical protein